MQSLITSLRLCAAVTLRTCSLIVRIRVDGVGGSTSRIRCLTSSKATSFSRSPSSGVVPVRSS